MISQRKGFFKVVCTVLSDLEFQVVEDVNRGSWDEVHSFIDGNINKYPEGVWMIYPFAR